MNTSITKSRLKELVKEVMVEENEYQEFFQKALDKAGKDINAMSDEEKKDFFNKIDSAWNGKGEKNESVNEATLQKGTKLRYDKNTFVVDYVVDKKYTGRDGFPKYILKVVKSNYPNKIKVGSTEEYDDSRLTGLIRNKVMTFVKNESVSEDISTELPKASIPSAVKQKLGMAIDKIKDAKLSNMQKLQLVAQVVDALGVDKTQLGTIATRIRNKMESKK